MLPAIRDFQISDDSGVLALVDCAAYATFVDPDWQYEQLLAHFRAQAQRRTIVVWDGGDGGGLYRVRFRRGITHLAGCRSAAGAIRVTAGALHLVSYTALTMAAQYADETLPAAQEAVWRLPLDDGDYRVRVVQFFDPDAAGGLADGAPHFVIELETGESEAIENVAWFSE